MLTTHIWSTGRIKLVKMFRVICQEHNLTATFPSRTIQLTQCYQHRRNTRQFFLARAWSCHSWKSLQETILPFGGVSSPVWKLRLIELLQELIISPSPASATWLLLFPKLPLLFPVLRNLERTRRTPQLLPPDELDGATTKEERPLGLVVPLARGGVSSCASSAGKSLLYCLCVALVVLASLALASDIARVGRGFLVLFLREESSAPKPAPLFPRSLLATDMRGRGEYCRRSSRLH